MRCIAATLALCLMLTAFPLSAADPARTISVRGRAEVIFPPDFVTVSAGVVERDDDAKTAQSRSRERAAAVLSFLRGSGVAPEDLAADRASLREDSDTVGDDCPSRSPKRYFEASVGIRFKLRDLQKYDDVLEGITKLGANRLYAVESESTVRTAKAREARIQAVQAAKQKATYLAEELGLTVGPPISVTEVIEKSYFDRSVLTSNSMTFSDDSRGPSSAAFSPSDLTVAAEFDVVFEIGRAHV